MYYLILNYKEIILSGKIDIISKYNIIYLKR